MGRPASASSAVVHVHRGGPLVALVGNPNCGKTSLFNLLTGSRQKVANYAGVTVERKEGALALPSGRRLRLLDLPGTYSLHPRSPDERVTGDVLRGHARGEKRPDLVVCVVDAANLRRNLRLVLAVRRLGLPCVVALNMVDQARRRGIDIDPRRLGEELGLPVVATSGHRADGADALRGLLDDPAFTRSPAPRPEPVDEAVDETGTARPGFDLTARPASDDGSSDPAGDADRVRGMLERLGLDRHLPPLHSDRIDRVLLHPVAGPLVLAAVLFLMFQAVFAWAEAPMGWIESGTAWVGTQAAAALPEGWLRSLVVDGVIAGLGAVLVFLPQILILFWFILVLEDSGYLPRAAFLLDRLMGAVGLSGRSFSPLLSSFACAIPGIMATRAISDPRDRRITLMLAPLMTCSARLPVYALLIGAFVPARTVGGLELQGLVLFGLYLAGIVGAGLIAWVFKRFTRSGREVRPLMMELPAYHWPAWRHVALGLWQRATIFLRRVGGIILALTVLLWLISSVPGAPPGAGGPAILHSIAGRLGQSLAVLFEPLGFPWQLCIALIPAMAAREVVVSALGTVYALSAVGDDTARALVPLIQADWSLPSALALMAWFVFAPQCIATLATLRRETGGWRLPLTLAAAYFALAWVAAWGVRQAALAAGWG